MMNERLDSVVMSSENGFQDSQRSGSSNIRKKVDVLNGRENGNSKCNLRMSLAWDSAFFTSPGVLEHEELFTTLNSRNYDSVVNILGKEEHLLLSSQSLEPDTNSKAENYNFRKSLAWDNGFFNSEGVLNPYELAIFNNGFKKSESHLLPVIEDEAWKSAESNAPLDSEGSSLTRLEMDLFEDIRSSIPKPASAEQDRSRTKMKTMPTCRMHSTNQHGPKKITREMSETPKVQMKHLSSSSFKPSKASEQTNPISRGSTKSASLGEKHIRLGCKSGILASTESLDKLKKPCLRDSFYAIHGSTESLRSSLLHCSTPTSKSVSCTKSKVPIGKPQPPNLRRKVNSTTTPLMKTRASSIEMESSCQSTPTSSWYGSSSSSIDECPSVSLSTSARSNRGKHSPYSSLRSSENKNQDSQVRHEESANQRHRKESKDHKGDGNADTFGILREVKPSGLRKPSPKLGFFDAVKENVLELAMVGEAKQDVVQRSKILQSPRTVPSTTEIRRRKSGGTPISVSVTKSNNRSPTVKSKIVQCCSKAEKMMISQYPKLDFESGDDKENRQIQSLVNHVNSIHLNNGTI